MTACAPAPLFGADITTGLIEDLATHGWSHAPGALEPGLVAALRAEAEAMDDAGDTRAGRIGRGSVEARRDLVRRTRIAWMDGSSLAQRQFLSGAEALRLEINRALFAGLFEFEAQFAVYPPGGYYARHLDAFASRPGAAANAALGPKAARSRVVSVVAFLNQGWSEADGGRLAIWNAAPDGAQGRPDLSALDAVTPAADIAPQGGGLVLMLSERIPHEVRRVHTERHAIAGWFRVNASIGGAIDPLR
jgi:SM-20-related protein